MFLILLITSAVLNDITNIWAKSLVVILSVPITLQGLASIQFNINKFAMIKDKEMSTTELRKQK